MKHPFSLALFALSLSATLASARVECAASATSVACFDFVELRLDVSGTGVKNPCTDIAVAGTFGLPGEAPLAVQGFCDAADGSVFRVRLMPSKPGTYSYTVMCRAGDSATTHEGKFEATDGQRRGLVRIDPEYASHMQYAGTQERFFWNGFPANALLTCEGENLRDRIDELDRARITGLLLAVPGSESGCAGSCEADAKKETCGKASIDLAQWQRYEQVVAQARKRDMAVAIGFGAASGECEVVRYAVARLAAFRNVIWDCSIPAASCDGKACAQGADTDFARLDPYKHLTSVPGRQSVSAGANTAVGTASGSAMNDGVRRAWEVCLAGSYPTVDQLPAANPSTDADVSAALEPYGHLYDFFTGVRWWEMQPSTDLVVAVQPHPATGTPTAPRIFASRNPSGDLAAIYVQDGGVVTVKDDLLKDQLKPLWFSPRDGGMRNARAVRPHVYRTPTAEDWVLLFRTPCNCSFRDFDNEFEN